MTDTASVRGLPTPKGRDAYLPAKPTLPWERQPGEPVRAYRGFARYRDLDPETRSIRQVAEELHLSESSVHQWRHKWRWTERVNAWEQEQDRRNTQARLKAIEKMNERHVGLAQLMQSEALKRLRDVEKNPVTLSNRDLERWVDRSVRVERLARGLTDNTGPNVNVTVSQQTAAVAKAEATTVTGSIADILAANPDKLFEANQAIAGLISMSEEGHDREPDEVLPGMPVLRDVPDPRE